LCGTYGLVACTDPPNQAGVSILSDIVHGTTPAGMTTKSPSPLRFNAEGQQAVGTFAPVPAEGRSGPYRCRAMQLDWGGLS